MSTSWQREREVREVEFLAGRVACIWSSERQAHLVEIATVGRLIQLFELCFIEFDMKTLLRYQTTQPIQLKLKSICSKFSTAKVV